MAARELIQRWSTEDVAPEQRLDYYACALASRVDPMAVIRRVPGPIRIDIASASLEPIDSVLVHGQPHVVQRGREEIKRSEDGGHFRLIVNRASAWNLSHRGSHRLAAGELVLLDTRFEHRSELPADFESLHLKLPAVWLRTWIPQPELLAGHAMSRAPQWGSALSAFISALTPERIAAFSGPGKLLVDQLGALLALTAGELNLPAPAATRPEVALCDHIEDLIRQRCCEPGLTAADLASEVHVSVRTFHRILAGKGLTFGELLMAARTDLARRMLASRPFDRLTIAEVGFRSGFVDPSHFARALRQRTGLTPRQLRQPEGESE